MEWWQILLLVEGMLTIASIVGFFEAMSDGSSIKLPLPNDLKEDTDMNWFGAWLSFIFLFLLFTVEYIIKLVYLLCHIGGGDVEYE